MTDEASYAVLVEHFAQQVRSYAIARAVSEANAQQHRGRLMGGKDAVEAAERMAQHWRNEIDAAYQRAQDAGVDPREVERFSKVIELSQDHIATLAAHTVTQQRGGR